MYVCLALTYDHAKKQNRDNSQTSATAAISTGLPGLTCQAYHA